MRISKRSRIWGPADLNSLRSIKCDYQTCPNILLRSNGYYGRKQMLGCTPREGAQRVKLEDQYRIPASVITFFTGWERKVTDFKEVPRSVQAVKQGNWIFPVTGEPFYVWPHEVQPYPLPTEASRPHQIPVSSHPNPRSESQPEKAIGEVKSPIAVVVSAVDCATQAPKAHAPAARPASPTSLASGDSQWLPAGEHNSRRNKRSGHTALPVAVIPEYRDPEGKRKEVTFGSSPVTGKTPKPKAKKSKGKEKPPPPPEEEDEDLPALEENSDDDSTTWVPNHTSRGSSSSQSSRGKELPKPASEAPSRSTRTRHPGKSSTPSGTQASTAAGTPEREPPPSLASSKTPSRISFASEHSWESMRAEIQEMARLHGYRTPSSKSSRVTRRRICKENESPELEIGADKITAKDWNWLTEEGKASAFEMRLANLRMSEFCLPGTEIHEQGRNLCEEELAEIAKRLDPEELDFSVSFIKGAIEARDPYETDHVLGLRAKILADFAGTVFDTQTGGDPPVRGPYGEAEIILKPGAIPVKQKMFQIQGERKDAWIRLTGEIVKSGKIEPGMGPWNSPSFPVPKKKPGEYRLVEDFRR